MRRPAVSFAVNNRKNALLDEHGYWYQNRPETLRKEDYLAARMISDPICLFDCDIPVQGSASFIVTTADRARDLRQRPAYVLSHVTDRHPWRSTAPALEDFEDNTAELGRKLWEASGLGSKDVDVANLYDGYLCITPLFLEGLGFCGKGESLPFFQDGRIEIGGEFPLNTSSGNNGGGRMHGVLHILDSVLQVQGRSGPRHVEAANVAVAAVGPPNGGQVLLLGREPR